MENGKENINKKAPPLCGLLIQLEKNSIGQHQQGSNYIIGYYDRLTITHVRGWLKYTPAQSALSPTEKAESLSIDDYSISSYPIKLIFPQAAIRNALEKEGFDYDSWRNYQLSYRSQQEQGITASAQSENLFDKFPCISIILINLTDGFKDNSRDFCNSLLTKLSNKIKNSNCSADELKNAHCCILPSIGYSDYCILMAEENWDVSLKLMGVLHGAVSKTEKGKEVPVLSTDYLMPAYHAAKDREIKVGNQGRLAVRASLYPGVSMNELANAVGDAAEVYQTSGPFDCLLVSKGNPSALVQMLMPRQKHGKRTIANLVIGTESFLQGIAPLVPTGRHNELNTDTDEEEELDNKVVALTEALKDYQKLVVDNHRHMRQLSALYECMTSIKNFFKENHNKSLKKIMGDWIPAFTACLELCTKEIEKGLEKEKEIEEESGIENIWNSVEEALEKFIDQVGSFLADLSRSDCFFMEIERYNHPSVSSATMLLIAYNQWLNAFTRDVMETAGIGDSSYYFLVRSGGCDHTETTNLFWFLRPALEDGFVKEKLPLISQMSEMSLFECSGAVFRMIHECMHYCGNRERKERAVYIISFVSRYYAIILSNLFFSFDEYPGSITARFVDMFGIPETEISDILASTHQTWLNYLQGELAEAIEKELERSFKENAADWMETDYMMDKMQTWLTNILSDMFSCYEEESFSFNAFTDTLYFCLLDVYYKFFEECSRKLHQNSGMQDISRLLMIDERRIHWHHSQSKVNKGKEQPPYPIYTDAVLERLIPHILHQLLMIASDEPEKDTAGGTEENAGDEAAQNSIASARRTNIFAVWNVTKSCFSETFADLEACIRLDASLTDYLLAFVYENWELDKALNVKNDTFLFRIPVILHLCFADELTPDGIRLKETAKEKLLKALDNLVWQGLPENRINGEELIQHINKMLEIYAATSTQMKWVSEPLVDYLKLCEENYQSSPEQRNKMARYQEAFGKIRVSDLDKESEQGEESDDRTVNMFRALAMICQNTDMDGKGDVKS